MDFLDISEQLLVKLAFQINTRNGLVSLEVLNREREHDMIVL